MTTAPRPRPTLGHRLAKKALTSRRPRRKPSTRPRRDDGYSAEAKRIIAAAKVAYTERQIEQSPIGRHILALSDKRTRAGFREDFSRITLHAAREAAERARTEHSRVCNQGLHQQYEPAHFKLKVAETRARRATQLHRRAVEAREMVDCELRTLARTVAGSR